MNPEFYEDEVIEGFYVPSMIKKAWGAQLDVLKETDAICTRHNIPYFADWGTLLATIRHNGYIPWDDDLDISMRRKDYERFLSYAETELPEGFKVMHFKNHPGHHFFVARIVGKPRICFEEDHLLRFHGFPYIAGIDLFVLDNVCADRSKEKLKAKMAEFVITVADNIADGKVSGGETADLIRECEGYTGKKIDSSLSGEELRIRMYTLAEELFASIPDEESDALVQMMPFGMYGNERYIPKDYYRDTVRLPYMDTTMSVPICYDAVMRKKFGNYMQIVRTWSGHDYPFFYGQHEKLLAALDFEYPAYKADEHDLTDPCIRKEGIKEKASALFCEISQKAKELNIADMEASAELQGIAVELGTGIESVYGEGYGPVSALEELCELAYRKGCGEDVSGEISECIERTGELVKSHIRDRRDIVFIPFSSKHWKYMEPLYRHYKEDESISVHVVAIPYYYRSYDGSLLEEVFDVSAYPGDIKITDWQTADIENMHPEKIVIQNPFDEWNTVMTVPKRFYSSSLRNCTDELMYVPFFVTDDFTDKQEREYRNMDAYVCVPGVINADKIILASETMKDTYIKKIMEFTKASGQAALDALDEKIAVSPEYVYLMKAPPKEASPEGADGRKKTILYFTTISFLAENKNRAVDKIQRVIDTFSASGGKIDVVWVTQCMDQEISKLDKDVADGFGKAVKRFESLGIGEFGGDIRPEGYCEIVGRCDAYYGDPSALALKFFYADKPVMIINADV